MRASLILGAGTALVMCGNIGAACICGMAPLRAAPLATGLFARFAIGFGIWAGYTLAGDAAAPAQNKPGTRRQRTLSR